MEKLNFKVVGDNLFAEFDSVKLKNKGVPLDNKISNFAKSKLFSDKSYDIKITIKANFIGKDGKITEKDINVRISDLSKAVGLTNQETNKMIKEYNKKLQKGNVDAAEIVVKVKLKRIAMVNVDRKQIGVTLANSFNEPPSANKIKEADKLVIEIKNKNYDINKAKSNVQLTQGRKGGSTTLSADNPEARRASERWDAMNDFIFDLATKKKPITLNDIRHINGTLNEGGGSGEGLAGSYKPGSLRGAGSNISAGQIGSNRCYVYGDDVEPKMNELVDFINQNMKLVHKGEQNPIMLGAQVFQRMVSIHPFHDANGRTSRLVMDYVLIQSGLPPLSPGEDVKVAIFGLIPQEQQDVTSDLLLDKAMNWMKNSSKALE